MVNKPTSVIQTPDQVKLYFLCLSVIQTLITCTNFITKEAILKHMQENKNFLPYTVSFSKAVIDLNVQCSEVHMNFFCDSVCNYCSVLRQSCSGRYTVNAPLSLVGPYALPIPNHLHTHLCSSGFDHRTAGPHDYSNAARPVIGHHQSPSHDQAFSQFSQVSTQLDLMCEHSFISFY